MLIVVGHHDASHQARQVCLRLVQLPMPIEKPQTPTMSTCNGFPVGFPIQTHHSFENTRCLNTQPVFSMFEKAGNHEFAMRLGKIIDFFFICQNHKLKQSLKAKGPGHFPYSICQPLCFAQDHASVPLCCVSCLGFSIAAVLLQYCCSIDTTTATVLLHYWPSTGTVLTPVLTPLLAPVLTPLLAQYCSTDTTTATVLLQY